MTKALEAIHEITERKERVHSILRRYEGEALWDTMKAKDVDPEILEHIQIELAHGKELRTIRRELGIASQTSKQWIKISAALKAGWRVDSAGLFITMLGRQEKLASKMYKLVDEFLDTDSKAIEELKKTDKKGVPLLDAYIKYMTPMIDALGRNQKTTVEIGKALGVFQESNEAGKSQGTTIVIQNNVPLPTPQQILDAKRKTIEVAGVVKPKT